MVVAPLCDPLSVRVKPKRPFPEMVICPEIVNGPATGLAMKFCTWLALRLLKVWLAGLKLSPLSDGVTE